MISLSRSIINKIYFKSCSNIASLPHNLNITFFSVPDQLMADSLDNPYLLEHVTKIEVGYIRRGWIHLSSYGQMADRGVSDRAGPLDQEGRFGVHHLDNTILKPIV
jgi:hypothetical protein